MKIVIDIPDAQYEYLAKIMIAGEEPLGYFERVIMRGTPLPKYHGRLISEKDMLSVIMFSKLFDDAKVGEVKKALLNIPTIIEADKEYEK